MQKPEKDKKKTGANRRTYFHPVLVFLSLLCISPGMILNFTPLSVFVAAFIDFPWHKTLTTHYYFID